VSENVELVRRSFEAMSAWDVEVLLELHDPDVEFLPLTGTRVGSAVAPAEPRATRPVRG
jgi:ketosteroid isomerase-like protein